jgi:hypothetical protein
MLSHMTIYLWLPVLLWSVCAIGYALMLYEYLEKIPGRCTVRTHLIVLASVALLPLLICSVFVFDSPETWKDAVNDKHDRG